MKLILQAIRSFLRQVRGEIADIRLNIPKIDNTLSKRGQCADALAVRQALTSQADTLLAEMVAKTPHIEYATVSIGYNYSFFDSGKFPQFVHGGMYFLSFSNYGDSSDGANRNKIHITSSSESEYVTLSKTIDMKEAGGNTLLFIYSYNQLVPIKGAV